MVNGKISGPVRPGTSESVFRATGASVPSRGASGGISGPVRPGTDEEVFRATGKSVPTGSAQAVKLRAEIKARASQDAKKAFDQAAALSKSQRESDISRTIAGQIGGGRPSAISGVSSPGGIFTGAGARRPFVSKLRESGRAAGAFARAEGGFGEIFTPFDPKLKTPEIAPSLFRGAGGGTIIQDPTFQPAEFRSTVGLTAGELKLQLQTAKGEVPEITFEGGRAPTFGTAGVPAEAVEKRISERAGTQLQADIEGGSITFDEDETKFQEQAQAELSKRVSAELESFRGKRRGTTEIVEGLGRPVPIVSGLAEIGAITALSTTPAGSAIAGALLTSRGSRGIIESTTAEDLTFGQRATGVGLGVVDIGFGLGIGGRGVTQARGGLLSKQAIREAERDLGSTIFVPPKPGRVIGRGSGTALIETSQVRQLGTGGLTKQEIKSLSLVTEVSGGRVAVPGGRAISRTQIFDPISGQIIKGTPEEFIIGTKFPLDVSRGGRGVTRRGGKTVFEQDIQELISVEGTAFVRPKGRSGFTEFDILATGGKTPTGTGVLGFQRGQTLISTEEALFKETGRQAFLPSGRAVTRFQRGGTRISPTERIFKETGDGIFGRVGDPFLTEGGLPVVRIERTGARVRDATSLDFVTEAKGIPKLGDLFDTGPQPFRPVRGARRGTTIDFTGDTRGDIIQLTTGIKVPKTPKITPDRLGPGGQITIQTPAAELTTFEEASKVAAVAVSRGAGLRPPVSVADTSFRPLTGIPRASGGAGLTDLQIDVAQTTTDFARPSGTLLIEKRAPVIKVKPGTRDLDAIGLITEPRFDIGTQVDTTTRFGTSQAIGTAFDVTSIQASLGIQAFKPGKLTGVPATFAPTFGPAIGPSFEPTALRGAGFGFPGVPSLGGGGAPRRRRKGKKVRRKIAPSFTGIVLEIETGLPKAGVFGLSPFAIRGIGRPKKKKKSKKKK